MHKLSDISFWRLFHSVPFRRFTLFSFTLIFCFFFWFVFGTLLSRHRNRYQKVNIFTVKWFENENEKKRSGKHADQNWRSHSAQGEKKRHTEKKEEINVNKIKQQSTMLLDGFDVIHLFSPCFFYLPLPGNRSLPHSPGKLMNFLAVFALCILLIYVNF